MNWYNQIEEPIRPLVKALRDNGINTTNSCGHNMSVQVNLMIDGELKRIHDTVYNWMCKQGKEPEYDIEVHVIVRKGTIFQCFAEIRLQGGV